MKDKNAMRAGLFIVVTVALVVAIIIGIEGASHLFEPMQDRIVSFTLTDDIGGLRIGDDVRAGGYKIGSVSQIDLTDTQKDGDKPQILVHFTIPTRVILRSDAVVRVQSQLTGSSSLNIESLGTGAELAAGAQLAGQGSAWSQTMRDIASAAPHIAGIVKQVDEVTIPKVNSSVDTAKHLLTHLDFKIDPVVAKYDKVTVSASDMLTKVGGFVGPSTGDFHGAMADIHAITTGVREKLPAMLTKIDGDLDSAKSALADIQKTVANTRDISGSVKDIVLGNRGKIEGMIAAIKRTSDNLENASIEIRHSPWRLLYHPEPGELSNLNLFDSAREFSQGAGNLNDAAQALRDAIKAGETNPDRLQHLLNQLNESFDKFNEVESKLWNKVQK